MRYERRWGYFRFDSPAEQEALAEVYAYLCPLYNYWYPSFRLIDKEKGVDGRSVERGGGTALEHKPGKGQSETGLP
jgi:hypothetical protein